MALSLIMTAAYSFATQVYDQDQIEDIVSNYEGAGSIGNALGPFLGSVVYYFTSFEATLFFFGSLMVPPAFIVLATLSTPKIFKESVLAAQQSTEETDLVVAELPLTDTSERLTYWKLISL